MTADITCRECGTSQSEFPLAGCSECGYTTFDVEGESA